MSLSEELERLDGRIVVEDTPIGRKVGIETPIHDEEYQATVDGMDAGRKVVEEYEDVIISVYEALGDEEAVGRVIAEADVPELPRVVEAVADNDIPLDAEDCRTARDD